MRQDDRIRLRHMLDAAREAVSFAAGKRREDLDHSRMLVLSLVKDIEIIGEAATKVSDSCRQEHSKILWKQIITMRNRVSGELSFFSIFNLPRLRFWRIRLQNEATDRNPGHTQAR